jgi:ABC-type polysaccharide/polyol phosphate export permease
MLKKNLNYDVFNSIKNYKPALEISKSLEKTTYSKSKIHLFWIPIKAFSIISALTLININFSDRDINFLIQYITMGYIFWTFLNDTLVSSCRVFINFAGFIKNLNISLIDIYLIHFYRSLKNFFINIGIFFPLLLIFSVNEVNIISFCFGILILIFFTFIFGLLFAIINSKFRDFNFFIETAFRLLFFITPIWWIPNEKIAQIPIIKFNLIYMMIENIRNSFYQYDHSILMNYLLFVIFLFITYIVLSFIYKFTKTLVFWL